MRKALAILITFIIVAVLAGCTSATSTSDSTAVVGEAGWEKEYVQVPNGDVILCLWHKKHSTTDTMDCDWTPTNMTPEAVVGEGYWEEEYVTISSGKTIVCIWYKKNVKYATRSCNFDS